ncbi:MAG: DUF2878 family protein [Candidatus Aenigmarchaeota archaeon]|nr:DUF2878 family protein [Candidatus Aenigmarchaeota archaeon]
MIEEVFVSLIIIFSISFVALLWRDVVLLTAALLILAIFSLRHFHKKNDVIIFFMGAITGASAELVCIYFGAWKYTNPTYLIPLWLPVLWGIAAIVIRRFAVEIDKRIK